MMNAQGTDGLAFEEEDRLPWLEAAEDVEEGISPLRMLGVILGGLLLLAIIVGGLFWIQNRSADNGQGALIAAQGGSYKERPKDAGAQAIAGQGDASYAASEGENPSGTIDNRRLPEAPVAGTPATATQRGPAVVSGAKVSAAVVDGTGKAGSRFAGSSTTAAASPTMQLGAYGSQSGAQGAWQTLAKRFAYLAPLKPVVAPTKVGNTTLYRLRANAANPAQAAQFCGKLKVAGENCLVVAN